MNDFFNQVPVTEERLTMQNVNKGEISIPSSTLVEFDPKSDIIRGELVHIIMAWLVEQGLTSSAQLLRDEAASLLRQEHNERKTLRAISRAINEGKWDTADGLMKKLESITNPNGVGNIDKPSQVTLFLQSIPLLLAQQEFLEYVDKDDRQRAHNLFMMRIKPFEKSISKEHFQQLTYLLTCRNVSEAGETFPVWRGWTPMKGRSQLQSIILKIIGCGDNTPYFRQYEYTFNGEQNIPFKGLNQLLANSLSYELIKSQHPSLLNSISKQHVFSILKPLGEQLIPSNFITSFNVNKLRCANFTNDGKRVRLTACQPFLQVPAVAVGTYSGSILWIPLDNQGEIEEVTVSQQTCIKLYQYNTPVRGMISHDRQILLSWSGCQAVVLNMSHFIKKNSDLSDKSEYLTDCIANTFVHTATVCSSCLFPCGFILATGLSEGTVTIWDLLTGAKMLQHSFSNSAIESLTASRSGSYYFAASKEGLVRVVDVITGVVLFTFASPVSSEVSSIALSPSASLLLVSYRNGTLRLWDVFTGNILPQRFEGAEGNTRRCTRVTFGCVDSHIISGNEDGCLYLWDSGRTRKQDLSFSPNEMLGKCAETLTSEYDPLEICSSSTPGRYHWPKGEVVPPPTRIRLHRSPITDVKFQHHYILTCGEDGIVCICSSESKYSK